MFADDIFFKILSSEISTESVKIKEIKIKHKNIEIIMQTKISSCYILVVTRHL